MDIFDDLAKLNDCYISDLKCKMRQQNTFFVASLKILSKKNYDDISWFKLYEYLFDIKPVCETAYIKQEIMYQSQRCKS
ncbi:MAG: hypothetical protein RR538_06580 [Erysipelotrichaceae bacterium]